MASTFGSPLFSRKRGGVIMKLAQSFYSRRNFCSIHFHSRVINCFSLLSRKLIRMSKSTLCFLWAYSADLEKGISDSTRFHASAWFLPRCMPLRAHLLGRGTGTVVWHLGL
jgi:hypothetical protein